MQAFIHGANYRANGDKDTFWTTRVPAKRAPMAHHSNPRLTWTASGYGARIPTEYMVQFNGRWRRVYCRIYSNVGTLYIGRLAEVGERITVQIDGE